MPLIEIHAQPRPDIDQVAIARAVNAAVAEALGARLDAVWTVWRTIDGPFVRGDMASGDAPGGRFGPVVHVYHHRTPEQVERVVAAIEAILAAALSLQPGDVFITSQPVAIDA